MKCRSVPEAVLLSSAGIGLVNGIGTIDSDYRGEVKIALINWGDEPFVISNGERVAQMVAARYEKVEFTVADELSETERGSGGFGHTGVCVGLVQACTKPFGEIIDHDK